MERTTKSKKSQKTSKTNTTKKTNSQKTKKVSATGHSVWIPFWIGLFIFIIPVVIILFLSALPNAIACKSSTDCNNMITFTVSTIIATPFILYGAALSITGLCYAIASRHSTTNRFVHPFIWSVVLFAIFGLTMYLVMTNIQ